MKATILKGLPASGKTTYAKTLNAQHISKDIFRKHMPHYTEKQIDELQANAIKNANCDIVIDNTHLNPKTLDKVMGLCRSLGFEVEVIDMFDIHNTTPESYYNICTVRNQTRQDSVPQSVIDYMYLMTYGLGHSYYIVDIDGTIAKMNLERKKKLEEKNYDEFYGKLVLDDKPIHSVINIINQLYESNKIVLVSGRNNVCCDYTIDWLEKHEVCYNYLLMRNKGDHRPDHKLKQEIYNNCLSNDMCLGVFDDRNSVLEMWRSLGLFTFDVSQGLGNF